MRDRTERRPYFVLAVLWFCATLAVVVLFVRLDLKDVEARFYEHASDIYGTVQERIRLNEAILDGFAALFKVIPEAAMQEARAYAREMRQHYPHIYMIEVQRRIRPEEMKALEHEMKIAGMSTFRIRTFSREGSRTWQPVPKKNEYYPTVFTEPTTAVSREVLGLDIDSVPHLREALRQSLKNHAMVATPPFELVEGGRAYVMFKPATRSAHHPLTETGARSRPDLVTSLVVLTERLLSGPGPMARGLSCSMFYPGSDAAESRLLAAVPQIPAASQFEQAVLPAFAHRKAMESTAQPFLMVIRRQARWVDINRALILAFLVFSAGGLAATALGLRSRLRDSAERERACLLVAKERTELDNHVKKRTAELSQLNEKLREEVLERSSVEAELRDRIQENRKLSQKLLHLQEDERRLLARELHDEIGQALTAIRTEAVLVKHQNRNGNTEIRQSADAIIAITGSIYDTVQRIIRRLRPDSLDDLGLMATLEECVRLAKLEELGIRHDLSFSGSLDNLGEKVDITLYRIFQEALTNIVKHANADHVWVRLERRAETHPGNGGAAHRELVCLTVRDDGRGMDTGTPQQSFGLIGLRERVNAVNGTLSIESRPKEGVKLVVAIPLADTSGVATD